jgi:hypothetical protein
VAAAGRFQEDRFMANSRRHSAATKSSIHIKESHKGLFTAKAKKAGMSVQSYAAKVLKPGSGASAATKKQAAFAKAAKGWKKR